LIASTITGGVHVWDRPDFLDLPERSCKPRRGGLTHVLDKGMPIAELEGLLAGARDVVDVIKVGWGLAYIDRDIDARIAACHQAGVIVSLGGTLLEIAVGQGRLTELCRWARLHGVDALEVSNGLGRISARRKTELVAALAGDFVVLAEAGSKDGNLPVVAEAWLDEMEADLAAGASWVIAEGRESGTVGLYRADGTVRAQLVEAIAARVPVDRVIFESPQKAQQTWLIEQVGVDVNLGNIPPHEVLPLETLRLGLRADTAHLYLPARADESRIVALR
jgi:phosphosulfolactate synthase